MLNAKSVLVRQIVAPFPTKLHSGQASLLLRDVPFYVHRIKFSLPSSSSSAATEEEEATPPLPTVLQLRGRQSPGWVSSCRQNGLPFRNTLKKKIEKKWLLFIVYIGKYPGLQPHVYIYRSLQRVRTIRHIYKKNTHAMHAQRCSTLTFPMDSRYCTVISLPVSSSQQTTKLDVLEFVSSSSSVQGCPTFTDCSLCNGRFGETSHITGEAAGGAISTDRHAQTGLTDIFRRHLYFRLNS